MITYIDSVKERIKSFTTKNPDAIDAERIQNNPKYKEVLNKLEGLYIARNALLDKVEKLDLDIDACLMLLAYDKKKEEIDSRESKN